jgi:hypothetical protein
VESEFPCIICALADRRLDSLRLCSCSHGPWTSCKWVAFAPTRSPTRSHVRVTPKIDTGMESHFFVGWGDILEGVIFT